MTTDTPDNSSANTAPESPDDPRERLLAEAGVISWPELTRHFARGVVIVVSGDLDLIEVAMQMARDDADSVADWINQGKVHKASDDMARDWTARSPEFLCVVTAPWVLVQERAPAAQIH